MTFTYSCRKMAKLFANSGDPDQMPRSTAYDLGLHCLPITLYGSPNYNGLKYCWMSVDPDQMPKNLNWLYTFPQTCLGKYLDKYGTFFLYVLVSLLKSECRLEASSFFYQAMDHKNVPI